MTARPLIDEILGNDAAQPVDRRPRLTLLAGGHPQHQSAALLSAPVSAHQEELRLEWHRPDTTVADPQLRLDPEVTDPGPTVHRCLQLVTDALAGTRPPVQISRWATPKVSLQLCRRVFREDPPGRGRAHILRIRWMVVGPRKVEAHAVVAVRDRVRAVGTGLEFRHGRWIIGELDLP